MKVSKYQSAAEHWRRYIESQWPAWRTGLVKLFPEEWFEKTNTNGSAGMCDLTTVWLHSLIGGSIKFGFIVPGRKSHVWLEHAGLIIDLTADQFGFQPVVVTPKYEGIGDNYIEFQEEDSENVISFNREFLRLIESPTL